MDIKMVLAIGGIAISGILGFLIGKSMCKDKQKGGMGGMHPMMMGHGGGMMGMGGYGKGMGHPYMHTGMHEMPEDF